MVLLHCCHTARGQWVVRLLLHTAMLLGSSGQWLFQYTMTLLGGSRRSRFSYDLGLGHGTLGGC